MGVLHNTQIGLRLVLGCGSSMGLTPLIGITLENVHLNLLHQFSFLMDISALLILLFYRVHDFSITILRCCVGAYANNFFHHKAEIWNSLPSCFLVCSVRVAGLSLGKVHLLVLLWKFSPELAGLVLIPHQCWCSTYLLF